MSQRAIRNALQEPEPAGVPLGSDEAVVGVLKKFVNYGKGWKDRLFVLRHGILKYYRVLGTLSNVNIHQLFDALRAEGHVQLIGAEAAILEDKWRRHNSGSAQSIKDILADAQAEVHLQVATVEPSESDHCKFYVHTGTQAVFRVKCETTDDRRAWLEALYAAKAAWDGRSPSVASALTSPSAAARHKQEEKLNALLSAVQQELAERRASAEVQSYVAEVLRLQYQQYQHYMSGEADKRQELQRYVAQLENQHRQLETAVVVESQAGRKSALPASTDDGHSETSGASAEDGEQFYSDDEEQFFDSSSRRSSSGSAEIDGAMAGLRTSSGSAMAASSGEPEWIKQEGPPPKRRERLPKPQQAEKSISLWSILKEVVGKDLTRVCLPVYFNEPLSALQKMAEELEYSELVDKALTHPPGSMLRLLYITAFAISGYAGTAGRTTKPFNPLLGETYEFVCQEKGTRLIAEKVVHHPTVIAGHAEGRRWTLGADGDVRSKFWGRSIELNPVGTIRLMTDDGEEYTWHKVTTTIGNLILGKIYVDHGGVMRVRNVTAGLTARMSFKEQGLLRGRDLHQVAGIVERGKEKLSKPTLSGKWDEDLCATLEDGSTVQLWEKNPPPPDPTRYNLTSWAIKLNEITPGLEHKVAPTDCRLRPDQHATELGDYDTANQAKQRLETKQRAARKAAEEGKALEPRWFKAQDGVAMGEGLAWSYAGGYWESRSKGCWEGCRDIFGE